MKKGPDLRGPCARRFYHGDRRPMTEEYEQYRRAQAARWLEHVMSLGSRVRALRAEIEEQRSVASGLKAIVYDGMPRQACAYGDAIPDAVIRIQELIRDYCSELDGYVDEQRAAHEVLAKLTDRAAAEALTKHYLLGKRWELCCVEMGYSYDGMKSLRRRGLLEAYAHMPLEWRDPMHPAS